MSSQNTVESPSNSTFSLPKPEVATFPRTGLSVSTDDGTSRHVEVVDNACGANIERMFAGESSATAEGPCTSTLICHVCSDTHCYWLQNVELLAESTR